MKKSTIKSCSYLVSFISFTLWSFTLSATNQTFELTGITVDKDGPLSDVSITVLEGSGSTTQTPTSVNGQFKFELDFNKKFKITIEKEGYVSEDIIVNTALPQGSAEQTMSHQISLKMFSQSNETPFTFNEPVAKVFFNQVIKGFTDEMNYKKTFHTKLAVDPNVHDRLGNTGISEEFKYELSLHRHPVKKEIKVEEEKIADKNPETVIAIAEKTEIKEEIKVETAQISTTVSELKPITIAVEPVAAAIIVKKEKKYIHEEVKKIAYAEPVKKDVKKLGKEVIIEDTRQINKEVIKSKGKIIEFSYITYNNGGVYYFKNGACISAETYEREMKYTHQ